MKNSTTGTLVAVAAVLLGTIQTLAATVDGISGPVFVNKGRGFQTVTAATQINPGDIVMARDGGRAEVIYADGCRTRVEAGQPVSVASSGGIKDGGVELSPCAADGRVAGAGGIAPGALLVGGVVVAAGIGAAVILSNNDSKPSSP